MTDSVIGASVQRLEDHRLVQGKGRFVDDIKIPGLLVAGFVRSPYSHAVISSINADAALEVAEIAAVFTLDDLKPYLAEDRLVVGLPSECYIKTLCFTKIDEN